MSINSSLESRCPVRGRSDEEMKLNLPVEITEGFGEELLSRIYPLDGELTTEEQEAIGALPSRLALLIVRRGPNVGARFLLDADRVLVGRHPDADIFLDDVTVSRQHAEILREGSTFSVHDLGSLNGTYYENERIDTATLVNRSDLQIGKFRFTFFASPVDVIAPLHHDTKKD